MFQVTNLLTYHNWSVDNRDELLSELEHANAKRQPLDPPERLEVIHVDENGEVLEKVQVELPLQGTIDEVLEMFGFKQPTKSKRNFFSRFLPFGKMMAPQVPASDKDLNEAAVSNQEEKNSSETEDLSSSQEVLNQLIRETQLEPKFSEPDGDEGQPLEIERVQEEGQPIELTPGSVVAQARPQPFAGDVETESGKVVTTTLPPRPEAATVLPTKKQDSPAYPRDVESLTTYDLQTEFAGRIDREVSVIDAKITELSEQILRLEAQKAGHLKLLETITNYQLT